jgi:hypothetical protein
MAKTTHLLLFLNLIFFTTSIWAQDCNQANIYVSSQSQVNDFKAKFPNCTKFSGNFIIESSSLDKIVNLDGLSHITHVEGDFTLKVSGEMALSNAFPSLDSIKGDLLIRVQSASTLNCFNKLKYAGSINTNGSSLVKCGGFSSLTKIGGELKFAYDQTILDIEGFNKLKEIGGKLQIEALYELKMISGFTELETVGGNVDLLYLRKINNTGLKKLRRAGAVSLSGLSNLRQIDFIIESTKSNPTDVNLMGLDSLKNIDQFFSKSTALQGLRIADCIIENIPISNITYVFEEIYLNRCNKLISVDLFQKLDSIGGNLSITSCAGITNLNGLTRLKSCKDLTIGGMLNLIDSLR